MELSVLPDDVGSRPVLCSLQVFTVHFDFSPDTLVQHQEPHTRETSNARLPWNPRFCCRNESSRLRCKT